MADPQPNRHKEMGILQKSVAIECGAVFPRCLLLSLGTQDVDLLGCVALGTRNQLNAALNLAVD